jgi:hypothetical protein
LEALERLPRTAPPDPSVFALKTVCASMRTLFLRGGLDTLTIAIRVLRTLESHSKSWPFGGESAPPAARSVVVAFKAFCEEGGVYH